MAETPDPIAALASPKLPIRAAGARDLAAAGGPEHLERLIDLAVRDPSPGVRLGVAAAAADILSRLRSPSHAAGHLPEATRRALYERFFRADPGLNAGLFQVVGTLDLPETLPRILLGLRDPRADVRVGALVGLFRHCASATVNGDAEREAAVVAVFADGRIRQETRAELARVCANVGYTSALGPAQELAASTARGVAAVAQEAVRRLETVPAADGVWVDLGIDCGEARLDAKPVQWIATVGSTRVWTSADGAGTSERAHPRRFLWWKRNKDHEARVVLQEGLRTLWAADADEQAAFGERLLEQDARALFRTVDPSLPLNGATLRLRGAFLLKQGDVDGALAALFAAVALKKTPIDAWWYLADALARANRGAEARPYLNRFCARAPKKSAFMAEAKVRLDALGGPQEEPEEVVEEPTAPKRASSARPDFGEDDLDE